MSLPLAVLSIAMLAASPTPTEPAAEESRSQVDTVVSESGYATEVLSQHREQKRVSAATSGDDAGAAGRFGDPGGGSPAGDSWRDVGFTSIGVPVGVDGPDGLCVVTDLVDPVAGLVPCDDLVRPGDGEDAGEDEESAGDEVEPVIITVTRSDFAELPLEVPVVHLQPEREWFLVNMETLVFTDGGQQVLETVVLDVPVRVRATPVQFAWDFGDGSQPLVTTDPGAPWPAADIGHVYTSEAQDVVITLTTIWSGEFQVAGQGPWIPIPGTTSTQSQSAPFRLEAVETRLTANH